MAQQGARANDHGCHVSCSEQHEPRQPRSWLILNVGQRTMKLDISTIRSAVIEKSINLEWMMNAIISQHYFGAVKKSFILEVLYDEYCSFALKRRILMKIC